MKANISRSGKHPWEWERKGVKLYHPKNMHRYLCLRHFTLRLFSEIQNAGGFVFYFGLEKTASPGEHNPNGLYRSILRQSIKRIDEFCEKDCASPKSSAVLLDEHDQRTSLLTQAARSMYGPVDQCKRLVEQPFHLESHRYQNLQVADWIAGLIGRMGAIWVAPDAFPENEVFVRYFGSRLQHVALGSVIRTASHQ